MSAVNPPPAGDEDLVGLIPLPLAQLYRRAHNGPTPQERHHHAFYLAEATLKLAASLRIGLALAAGLEPGTGLAKDLEQLCLPSTGHWAGFLRDTAAYLRRRPDAALLPPAGAHDALLGHTALPAVRAFAEMASRAEGGNCPRSAPSCGATPPARGCWGSSTSSSLTATRSSATRPSGCRRSTRRWGRRYWRRPPRSFGNPPSSAG